MKYIPLTQHFQTVALLYEKCADLSSQIDSLQSQIQNNDGQNEQMENEEIERQSMIIQDSISKVPEKQSQNEKRVFQIDEIEEEKQNQEKVVLKIGKSIEKSNKMKVSLKCDHCDKVFQTEKQYKKHQYGVNYRGNKDKSKSISQKDHSRIIEQKEKKDKRESQSKKTLETFQICL